MRAALGLLAIAALACLIALQPTPALRYSVGTPGEGRLPYGFWSAETNAEGSYRWSDGDSRLRFFGYGAASGLDVTIRMIGPQGSRGQQTDLRITAGEATLFAGPSLPRWRSYRLLVPPAGQGWQTPEIWIGGTLTSGIPGDARGVGVAIGEVQVRPLAGRRPLALAEYAAFAGLLMGLIWAGLSLAVGPRSGLAAALAAGGLLLLWVRLDPAGAAYLLPPLWGTLLLPLGALAAPWLVGWLAPRLRARPAWLAAGLGLGLAGAALLRARLAMPLGGGLLLAGALIAAAALADDLGVPGPAGDGAPWGRWWGLALAACTLLALALRLAWLDAIPFGLWRDEARHGMVALRILADGAYRPVYVPEVDIPALLFYLQTLSISLLGPTGAAVRAVPALAGGLTVLTIAALGRALWGRAAGLAAGLLLALSAWHIALSRLAFAAVLDPLLSLLALALLWRAGGDELSHRRRLAAGAAAGAALGLALYTYHPARLMPLAAALWLALRLGRDRAAWRRAGPALAAFALVASIVAGPLLAYWLTQPRDFNQRVGQVSLLDTQSGKRSLSADLNRNVELYALMWHVEGDQNARHNIPGTPMLDPISGLLFLVGLLLILAERRGPAGYALLLLLGVGLLPGLLSNGAPHAVRSVDAIAPALLIAAYAAARIAPALRLRPAAARIGLAAAALALLAAVNLGGYFGRVPYDPRVWDAFSYTADAAIGRAIQSGACRGPALAPKEIAEDDVMDYLAYGRRVEPFSLADLPARFPAGSCVFLPAGIPAADRARVERAIGGAAQAQALARYPGTGQPVFLMYQMP